MAERHANDHATFPHGRAEACHLRQAEARAAVAAYAPRHVVRLLQPVLTVSGRWIAPGTVGTVVSVIDQGRAYAVEFAQPFAVVLVTPDEITAAQP
jgi:hypothetical protein